MERRLLGISAVEQDEIRGFHTKNAITPWKTLALLAGMACRVAQDGRRNWTLRKNSSLARWDMLARTALHIHELMLAQRRFPNNYGYERRKGSAGRNNNPLARLSGSSRTNHKSKVLKLCFGYRQENAVEGNDGAFGTFHLSVARTRGS